MALVFALADRARIFTGLINVIFPRGLAVVGNEKRFNQAARFSLIIDGAKHSVP